MKDLLTKIKIWLQNHWPYILVAVLVGLLAATMLR